LARRWRWSFLVKGETGNLKCGSGTLQKKPCPISVCAGLLLAPRSS
jgi:hypothetical protein